MARIKNYLKGYDLNFTPAAKRDLKKLEIKHAADIVEKLEDLVKGVENLDITPLEGTQEPIFRLRVGDYRAIYEVKKHIITVSVIEVGHRKQIYRRR